ncbi:MAG TPA: iron ABC transporter substrate-binding protein [Acidimicrobiia bacterium]|nr:iron ABC transporter substrate-binding protein [Acidimicrobiia bacterium]
MDPASAPTSRRRLRPGIGTVALLAAVVVSSVGLVSCQSGGGDRVTVYSGRSEQLVGTILDRFEEATGISVDVRYGDSSDLALLITEEGDRSPADVFLSQSPGAVGFLDSKAVLAELPDSILDRVAEQFRAADGDWVGISGRVRVLVYNGEKVDPEELPDSVFDMTDARVAGRVGVAPTNASFIDFVTGMRGLVGDDATLEWLEGMRDNDVRTYANNIAIIDAVNRGEIDYGLVNHYYNEQAKAEDPGVASENYVFPDGDVGALILVTAAGVLESSDNPADARRLIEYLLSEDAQQFFAEETFEYPLAAGVEPVVADLPPIADIEAPSLELSSLGDRFRTTRALIEQAGLEG